MNTVASPGPDQYPVNATRHCIGGRWKALPHCGLRVGPKRFNEMRRMIPAITHRRLTRTIFPVVPPHVNPTLSDLGVSQMPVLTAMANRGAALSANATEHAA